jgi:oxidoreductase
MTRSILFCGHGWAVTKLWIPRLQRLGFDAFSFYDPAVEPSVENTSTLRHLELADSETIRLAIVASPNRLPEEQALAILRRGIPVVIEKPVCMSAKGCGELEVASLTTGVAVLRSCPSLYDPHFLRFRALFAGLASELDGITRVRARWLRSNGIPASKWLTSAVYSMAGSSLDLGWHVLEWVMAILDYPSMAVNSATFSGCTLDVTKHYASWYGDTTSTLGSLDVDTAALLSLKTQSGVKVELRTAWDADVANDEVAIHVEGRNGWLGEIDSSRLGSCRVLNGCDRNPLKGTSVAFGQAPDAE